MPGLTSKKLAGFRKKDACSTGMHGQSSQRGMWVTPRVCHSTRSTPSSDRFCAAPAPLTQRLTTVCTTWRRMTHHHTNPQLTRCPRLNDTIVSAAAASSPLDKIYPLLQHHCPSTND